MPKHTFRLTAVSPWLLNGADPRGQPELRAPSVRGQLRYWLRAITGAQFTQLGQIWKAESEVFGSTGQGSAVTVRVYGKSLETYPTISMMPHKNDQRERDRSRAQVIPADYASTLELVTRPGVPLPSGAFNALAVWSLLGGVGKRSRRMFGSVDVKPKDQHINWYEQANTPDDFAAVVQAVMQAVVAYSPQPQTPKFPTLHPNHSWIIVGRRVFDDPVDANVELFRDLLRSNRFRAHEQTFGQAVGGRRSSPLIAQVKPVANGVIPVLTAIQSTPDRNIRWPHLCDFMEAAAQHFDGVTVWGGRFA